MNKILTIFGVTFVLHSTIVLADNCPSVHDLHAALSQPTVRQNLGHLVVTNPTANYAGFNTVLEEGELTMISRTNTQTKVQTCTYSIRGVPIFSVQFANQ
jgi:predicted DNA-binding protein with PD1-like motif